MTMKPRTSMKRRWLQWLTSGAGRIAAKPLYQSVQKAQLRRERWLDRHQTPVTSEAIRQVTAIVKTFERPHCIQRLLESIERMYPTLQIIVADDSKTPFHSNNANVKVLHLPYNVGLSAGRTEALALVQTPYFLLLDDDFVFYRKTQILSLIRWLDEHPQVDIVGGEVVNLPEYQVPDYRQAGLLPTSSKPLYPDGALIDGLRVYSKIANFYLGRTQTVQKVGWNADLKLAEHTDFFTRAVGVLTTVMDPSMKVLHAKERFDRIHPDRAKNLKESTQLLRTLYTSRKAKAKDSSK